MKQSRTRLESGYYATYCPSFMLYALIVCRCGIFFTGRRYFLSTLLHFAEVPLTDNQPRRRGWRTFANCWPAVSSGQAVSRSLSGGGMKVTNGVRQRSVLSLSLAHSVRYIALAMVGMGILLPVCRFLIPLLAWWPQP
ncbi:DUF2975 domain-containing protein [Klebsiella variicola subsp. variicola]|nr:DUF2975 domain-containing protein [Klebsiella variicola subsp. variicola]